MSKAAEQTAESFCDMAMRTGIGSCKGRNLLGCSGAAAFDGGCDLVRADAGQVIGVGLQEDGLSAAANTAVMQSRKQTSVR